MFCSIFLVFLFVAKAHASDDKVEEAKKILLTKGTDGPDSKFVEDVVYGMESLTLRRAKFSRQGSGNTKETEDIIKKHRETVGPKDEKMNHTEESSASLQNIALEGDMVLNTKQINYILNTPVNDTRKKRAITTDSSDYWDASQPIYYEIDSSLYSNINKIREAIQFWSDNSCLRFVENRNARNRLRFYRGVGCWSYVGKQKDWASQDVSIGSGCESLGTICHEMLHALGFFHTQSRYDRDSYLVVNMNNIDPALSYNFEKLTTATETHYGMDYDYGSVMQYNPYAFARNFNIPTSISRDLNYQNMMGQRDNPAFSDVKQLNKLYKCESRCSRSMTCQNNGIINSKTCSTCLCPKWFSGTYCEQMRRGDAPICNGQTIQASSTSFSQFNASMGIGLTYAFIDDPKECFWRISAPSGRRIQVQVTNIDTQCREGCNWAGFEINLGRLDLSGLLTCCPSIYNTPYTSTGNDVFIRGHSRYNNGNMIISYRMV